jgi:hypothetical protein
MKIPTLKHLICVGQLKDLTVIDIILLKTRITLSKKNEKKTGIIDVRHTMIPICKWVPIIFDKYILNWELKNMYWLGNHTLHDYTILNRGISRK